MAGKVRPVLFAAVLIAGLVLAASAGLPGAASAGPSLVVAEYFPDRTRVWEVSAADPQSRRLVGEIRDPRGYGLNGSVAPDGRTAAYLVWPGRNRPETGAELWVLDLRTGGGRRLGTDLDLYSPPRWRPDGRAVVLRRADYEGRRFSLVEVDLAGRERELVSAQGLAAAVPVGWDFAGRLVWVSIGPPNEVRLGDNRIPLPEGSPRDFRLTPDGRTLALRLTAPGGTRLLTADLASGRVGAEAGEALVWGPGPGRTRLADGRLTAESDGRLRTLGAVGEAAEPLSWDPAGRHLVIRTVRGSRQELSLVDTAGAIRPLEFEGYPEFWGWAGGGP